MPEALRSDLPVVWWIDDDPELLDPWLSRLEPFVTVIVVSTARDALDRIGVAEQDPVTAPRIVLLDLMMAPGPLGGAATSQGRLTGRVLLQRLRQSLPDVPVLVLSNTRDRAELDALVAAGAVRSARKVETSPQDLASWVRELLS